MVNPVVHFEVVGKDANRLQRFSTQAFDWRMTPAVPGYVMAHPEAQGGINGGVGAAQDGGAGYVTFYVEVDDLKVALGKIEKLGGKTVAGPMGVPGGPSIATFAEREGHIIGLVKAQTRRG